MIKFNQDSEVDGDDGLFSAGRARSSPLARAPWRGMVARMDAHALNVLGGPLISCSNAPRTGFFRDGFCRTCEDDAGSHTICTEVTAAFLAYSVTVGNDLSTPRPEYQFPGLKPGDRWCVCAARWKQAYDAGCAPPVVLRATHERALEIVSLEELQRHAIR